MSREENWWDAEMAVHPAEKPDDYGAGEKPNYDRQKMGRIFYSSEFAPDARNKVTDAMERLVGCPLPVALHLTSVVRTDGFRRFFELVYDVYLEKDGEWMKEDDGEEEDEDEEELEEEEDEDEYLFDLPRITKERFVLVCRYLLLARVQDVYCKATHQMLPGRIPFPHTCIIGEPVVTVIKNVGVVKSENRGLVIVPVPEDDAEPWSSTVIDDDLRSFQVWMKKLRDYDDLHLCTIWEDAQGSPFWTLQATEPISSRSGTLDDSGLVVRASHCDWSAADGLLCLLTAVGNEVRPLDNVRFTSEVLEDPKDRAIEWIRGQFRDNNGPISSCLRIFRDLPEGYSDCVRSENV